MKEYFRFDIRGGDWWLPILAYWLVSVIFNVPIQVMNARGTSAHLSGVILGATIVFMFVIATTVSLAYIVILRKAFDKLSVGAHTFSFRGSMGRFLGINLIGGLLSMITLGIYFPWYIRRAFGYLVSETKVDETPPSFLGRGGRLFKYLLLSVYLPIIVFSGALVLYFGLRTHHTGAGSQTSVVFITFALYLVLFVVISIFAYLNYKWLVQIKWKERTIVWKTTFWKSVGMILGQLFLSIITLFIYSPASAVRLYRYFAARTVVEGSGGQVGRFGFDGSINRGFLVLWGQILLTLITVGIYLPWAYARIFRWVAQYTYYEPAAAVPARETVGNPIA